MTKQEFINYQKTGVYKFTPIVIEENDELYKMVPNQSLSIEELMKRQAAGLPLPNLTATIHTNYNGYDLDNMPEIARRGVDIIDAEKAYERTRQNIIDTEDNYAYEKQFNNNKNNKN